MTDWRPNPGTLPGEARGKRVVVKLADGTVHGDVPVTSTAPLGWPADHEKAGRMPPINWRKTGSKFDVAFWRPL